MRKWKYYAAAGALLIPAVALATDTAPYISGTAGITPTHVLAAGATVGQIVDGGPTNSKFSVASWAPGMNLSGVSIPIAHFNLASTANGAFIRVETAVGGTATVQLWFAPSGTACASGTHIETTPGNANGTAVTTVSLGVTNAAIAANSDVCAVFPTNAAWATSVGSGSIQLTTSTP